MRIAVTIAGADALPTAFVVWRGFRRSMIAASEFGYDGVELALMGADEVSPAELRAWIGETGMQVSSISTGQLFAARKLCFTSPDLGIRRQTVLEFNRLIDLAADFGQMVNIGRVRGSIHPGQTAKQAQTLFSEALIDLSGYAEKRGVTLVIEPVNRYEINYINTLDEGSALLDELNHHALGLMPDVFHMNIEDDQLGESLIRNARHIRYVHLADSNRHAPGDGHLDFKEVFAALQTIGYDGWITAEILPYPSPDEAARRAIAYLRPRVPVKKA